MFILIKSALHGCMSLLTSISSLTTMNPHLLVLAKVHWWRSGTFICFVSYNL